MDNELYVKYGKDVYGRQRYRHRLSGCVTIDPAESRSIPYTTKDMAIKMVTEEGLSFRCTARILGVTHPSVMKWVKEHSEVADYKELNDYDLVETVEVDEIYVITNKKKAETNTNMSTLQ